MLSRFPPDPERADPLKRVLVLCTGNSCRSQIAESLWRHLGAGEWQAFSAGSLPTGEVHPMAIRVLEELGAPTEGLRSKGLDEFVGEQFDLVVTVCDHARQSCPVLPTSAPAAHWPFEDPAEGSGDEEQRLEQFRRVRDAIRDRIVGFLGAQFADAVATAPEGSTSDGNNGSMLPSDGAHVGADPVAAANFGDWMLRVIDTWPGNLPENQSAEYRSLVASTVGLLQRTAAPWQGIADQVLEIFAARGWSWNGFYLLESRDVRSRLVLAVAAGPPVCATLERRGGVGSSGMCFDSVIMNQIVATNSVRDYRGYVSCDGESGLTSVAGMACPIRGKKGKPIGVWDLDSSQVLEPSDAPFFDRFFATLSAVLKPRRIDKLEVISPNAAESLATSARSRDPEGFRLAQFLKWKGAADSGGVAKRLIQNGEVRVNGEVETRRGRRLAAGDVVQLGADRYTV